MLGDVFFNDYVCLLISLISLRPQDTPVPERLVARHQSFHARTKKTGIFVPKLGYSFKTVKKVEGVYFNIALET